MSHIGKINKIGSLSILTIGMLSVLVLFQNCSKGFQTSDQASIDPGNLAEGAKIPFVTLVSSPAAVSNSATANFTFSVTTNTLSTLQSLTCSLDAAPAVNCQSGFSATALSQGDHTITAIANDSRGNISERLTYVWRVDTQAPVVNLTTTPAATTGDAVARFEFTAVDATTSVARIECRYDAQPYAVCASPFVSPALANGAHTFAVRATDLAGNTSAERTYAWTVSLGVPTVTITSGPAAFVNVRTANFQFSGTAGGVALATYTCQMDALAVEACTSPKNYAGLADGAHTFRVIGRNAAGVASAPITASFTVDATVPTTPVITSSVPAVTNLTAASFSFSATDAGSGVSSYQCRMNAEAYAACTSPKNYTGIAAGANTFNVRAVDNAGNVSLVAAFSFTVNVTAPVVTITSSPGATTTATTADFAFTVSSAVTVAAIQCELDGAGFTACTSPKNYTGLTVAPHVFRVRATDSAGNSGMAAFNWTVQAAGGGDGATLYATNCASCHNPLASSTKLGRTATQISNAIVGNAGGMGTPVLRALSAADIASIALALQPVAPPPPPTAGTESPTRPLVGSRTYMASALRNIFISAAPTASEQATITNQINNLVLNKSGAFGGPCWMTDNNCAGGAGQEDTNIGVDMSPGGNSARSGYTIRACQEILAKDDVAVGVAMGRAGLTLAAATTQTNMAALFDIFFPGRTPTAQVLSDLVAVVDTSKAQGMTNAQAWKYPMYAMCSSALFGML